MIFKEADYKFQKYKRELLWDDMKKIMNGNYPEYVKGDYESSETWQAFFSSLEKKMGVAKFCEFISLWINEFLVAFLRYHFTAPILLYRY